MRRTRGGHPREYRIADEYTLCHLSNQVVDTFLRGHPELLDSLGARTDDPVSRIFILRVYLFYLLKEEGYYDDSLANWVSSVDCVASGDAYDDITRVHDQGLHTWAQVYNLQVVQLKALARMFLDLIFFERDLL